MTETPVVEAISREWKRLLDFDCPPAGIVRQDLDFRITEIRSGYSLKFSKRLFGAIRKAAITDPTVSKNIQTLYFAPAKRSKAQQGVTRRSKAQRMVAVTILRRNEAHLWSVFCYLIGRALNHFESMVMAVVVAEKEAEHRSELEKKLVVTLNKDIIKDGIRQLIVGLGLTDKTDGSASHYGYPGNVQAATGPKRKQYFAKVYWKGRRGSDRKTEGIGPDPESALADLRIKLESRQS